MLNLRKLLYIVCPMESLARRANVVAKPAIGILWEMHEDLAILKMRAPAADQTYLRQLGNYSQMEFWQL